LHLTFLQNLLNLYDFHPDFFPLLLLFHDIGRPFNREWHTYESAEMIKDPSFFSDINLTETQLTILPKFQRREIVHIFVGGFHNGLNTL